MPSKLDIAELNSKLDAAVASNQISSSAAENIRIWLTKSQYAEYASQVAEHIEAGQWRELDDAFWTVIPFGTGGRRGRMYPIGCNAINDRTIGESAQGLADYVRSCETANPTGAPADRQRSCAIAYDTRHRSRHFAELCASIMAANGFRIFFLDGYRSTPQLSFLVRLKQCDCGIMVTASHNPPSDNAVKVYWSTGGQVVPPHDLGIVERVMGVTEIQQTPFAEAVSDGRIILCSDEIDAAFVRHVVAQGMPGPRDAKIIYSPLHGVGEFAVVPVLQADGFQHVEVFAPHREPSGDFPNVPGNVSNPENPAVFEAIIARAQETDADLVLATDPDCDRMGAAAPRSSGRKGAWDTFTGNQLGALLADFVCQERQKAGTLSPEHFLVTTLVTTPLIRRIGDSYGIKTYDNVHVGFKWIAQQIDAAGPENFVFAAEESYGYLIGQYVRDKDGAAACMLMAELAAHMKALGKSIFDRLESLWWQHGYHAERQINLHMAGSSGMARMQALLQRLRNEPPDSLGGMEVRKLSDYASGTATVLPRTAGEAADSRPLDAPRGNMIVLDLAREGHRVAIRPSGTEPKIKFYLFAFEPAERLHLLEATREEIDQRLQAVETDLRRLAEAV